MIRKMLGELLFTPNAKRLIDSSLDPIELHLLLSLYKVYIEPPSAATDILIIGDYPLSFSEDLIKQLLKKLGMNLDIYEVVGEVVFRSKMIAIKQRRSISNKEGSS